MREAVRGGCRARSVAGPPPISLLPFSASVVPSPPLSSVRPLPSTAAAALGGPRSFRLFPVRLRDRVVWCAPGVVRDLSSRAVAGARSPSRHLSLPPSLPSRRGSPALTVPWWSRRAPGVGGRCGVGSVPRSGPRVPRSPLSGSRVSAPLLSGYLAVAFRRGGLKTPGGVAPPPPGSGGGGARRDVGRPPEGFPVPPGPPGSPSDSACPHLWTPPPLPRRRSGGVRVSRAPSGRPWGPARAPGSPALGRVAAGCRVRGVPCPSRLFPFPTLWFFFFSSLHVVSFRFSLAGLRRGSHPVRPLSLARARRRAGGESPCRRQHPCESAHTPYTDTTLSGGSLGSCVDEERS